MDKLRLQIRQLIPDVLLSILLSSCISLSLAASLLEHVSYFDIVINSLIVSVICTALFWNAFTFLGSFSSVSFILIVFISFFDKQHYTSRVVYGFEDLFIRVYNYITSQGNIDGLEKHISLFICAVTAILCFFIIVKFKAYIFAVISGGIVFATQTILGYFESNGSLYIYVVAMVLLYIYSINHARRKDLDIKEGSGLVFIASAIPLALVVLLSVLLMPFSNEPVQWPWMDKKVTQVYDTLVNAYDDYTGKNDFFSLDKTGFGQGGKLGGSVTADDTEVLKVLGSKPVYLKAIGRDVYVGNGWKDSYTERKDLMDKDGFLAEDIYEMNFGLKLLNKNRYSYNDYFQVYKYDINFLNMRTKSIFLPKGLAAVDSRDLKGTANYNISTSMDSFKKKDFRYEVIAQIPRYESNAFKEALENSYDGLYKNMAGRMRITSWLWNDRETIPGNDALTSYDNEINLAQYAKKADEIRENYTKLPQIPQEIRDLTIKITAGQKTNYDKAKAIEKYLSDKYTYTLTPGDTPKDRDFVDYFLFEQKQGYCVHYASAMAVMARTIGLPSRYVEGFMMPHKQNDDGSYTVTNKNAHAWVEIYFEGAGWVQFEPTAAFNGDFYKQEEVTASGSSDLSFEDEEATPEPEEVLPQEDINTNLNNENQIEKFIRIIIYLVIILIVLALALLVTVTVNIERYRHKIRKYKALPASQSMVKLYQELLRIMKKVGYGIEENETALQYGKRIDEIFYFSPVSFERFSSDFTEARYSNRQIDKTRIEDFDKLYQRTLEIYKKEKGKARFLIAHYITGTI